MRTGFGALAALGIMFVMGAGPAVANDAARAASSAQLVTTQVETGYVTTQGRRGGGGFSGRRGGGGGGFAPRRGRNFNRNVAIGVGALVLGGIIASQSARASGGGNSCGRWNYQCNNGAGWACRNLDRYC